MQANKKAEIRTTQSISCLVLLISTIFYHKNIKKAMLSK
jgi:hypothetical protein